MNWWALVFVIYTFHGVTTNSDLRFRTEEDCKDAAKTLSELHKKNDPYGGALEITGCIQVWK